MGRFTQCFTATAADIDALGHVNNAVWVRWIQEIATTHWASLASADQQAALIWVVTRHEIDYRGNIGLGGVAMGETWVAAAPQGARFDRQVRFTDARGKVMVEAVTTWALIDRASGRLLRVRPELAAQFTA